MSFLEWPRLILKQISTDEDEVIDVMSVMERCSRLKGNKPIRFIHIGRHPSNDIVLHSEKIPLLVSRYHTVFEIGDNKLVLHPTNLTTVMMSATNGTYLNNQRIYNPKVLKLGDIISFGGPKIVVRNNCSYENPFRYQVLQSDSSPMLVEVDPRRVIGDTVNDDEGERPAKRQKKDFTEDLLNDINCMICLDTVVNPHSCACDCGRNYCGECIWQWFMRGHNSCPQCNKLSWKPIKQPAFDRLLKETVIASMTPGDREKYNQRANQFSEFVQTERFRNFNQRIQNMKNQVTQRIQMMNRINPNVGNNQPAQLPRPAQPAQLPRPPAIYVRLTDNAIGPEPGLNATREERRQYIETILENVRVVRGAP